MDYCYKTLSMYHCVELPLLLKPPPQLNSTHENIYIIMFAFPDMNVWKEHYLQQLAHNQQLEVQLKKLERKVTELRSRLQESELQQEAEVQGYEGMSDVTMRQLLRRLEKEKAEVEWQLKDCEWRLDQEAAVSQCMSLILT